MNGVWFISIQNQNIHFAYRFTVCQAMSLVGREIAQKDLKGIIKMQSFFMIENLCDCSCGGRPAAAGIFYRETFTDEYMKLKHLNYHHSIFLNFTLTIIQIQMMLMRDKDVWLEIRKCCSHKFPILICFQNVLISISHYNNLVESFSWEMCIFSIPLFNSFLHFTLLYRSTIAFRVKSYMRFGLG